MLANLIHQMLTPLIFLVFALGFAAIWFIRRKLVSAGLFAGGYLSGSFAFALASLFNAPPDPELLVWFADTLFILTAFFFSMGVHSLYRERIGRYLIPAILVAALVSVTAFRFWHYDIILRSIAVAASTGLLFLATLPVISRNGKRPIDRVVFRLCGAGAMAMFAIALLAPVMPDQLSPHTFDSSLYMAIASFLVAALALALSVTLFVKYGMDIIGDLQRRSNTDELTLLLNRRGFEGKARLLLGEEDATAMILADIDHFKRVNDTHGHQVGDRALQVFAETLAASIRQSDLIGRIGGEEFCIILPGATHDGVKLLAERMRSNINAKSATGSDFPVPLTASFGVAVRMPGEDYEAMFHRADKALYKAKQAGRDRVEIAAS